MGLHLAGSRPSDLLTLVTIICLFEDFVGCDSNRMCEYHSDHYPHNDSFPHSSSHLFSLHINPVLTLLLLILIASLPFNHS